MAKRPPGERMKRARERLDLTEDALARRLGTTQTTVHRLENDPRRIPRPALAGAIERLLGIRAADWFAARASASSE